MSFLSRSTGEMVRYAKERAKQARADLRKAESVREMDPERSERMKLRATKDLFVAESIARALSPMLEERTEIC